MRKVLRAAKIALKCVLAAAMGLLLVYNVYMLVARYALGDGMPTLFGYGGAVIVSGSMEDALGVNDFVITKAEDEYSVGDIITFYHGGVYITHRIVLVSGETYATKGDANAVQDDFSVHKSDVVGRVVCVWKGFGAAVQFLQSPAGFFSALAGVAVLWLATDLISGAIGKKQDERDKN